jgi:very-short-patch-repair endonuclease
MNAADSASDAHESLVKDRAIRVFKFLRDLAELGQKVARDSSQYDIWWLSDLPRETGCHFVGWHPVAEIDAGTPWIEIKKPTFKPPPGVPMTLQRWLIAEQISESSAEPELQEIIEVPDPDSDSTTLLEVSEFPDIRPQWEQYLNRQWRPWAAQDQSHQRIQQRYSGLFSIYQKQKSIGESYEVVLSLGYFTWRRDAGYQVSRHLITAQVALAFDDVRGIISVGPAADGAKLTLEQDMLDVDHRPVADDIEEQLRDCEFVMWDGQTVPDALRAWVHRLSAEGAYDDSINHQTGVRSEPDVRLAPAIVMRRRTERTIVRLFKDLIKKFEAGIRPSAGIEHLVAIVDERFGTRATPDDSQPPAAPFTDLYLPLPANDEQRAIVDKLSRSQGVLVQGPPGTGKSHTIANLLCHLLACGKRVLVTSHTARALAVLRGKLPAEIADLCVVLLGNDLTALQGLENSVREITERYNNRNDDLSQNRTEGLERSLAQEREADAKCRRALRSIRESDVTKHSIVSGEYRGTTQEIAKQLHDREEDLEWIRGLIDVSKPVPLTDSEALELLDLYDTLDESALRDSEQLRPGLSDLPIPAELGRWLETVQRAHGRRESLAAFTGTDSIARFRDVNDDEFAGLRSAVSVLVAAARAFESAEQWVQKCRSDIVERSSHVWQELLSASDRYLDELAPLSGWATDRKVSGIDGVDRARILSDVVCLLEHLDNGGGFGFGPFRRGPVKRARYILDTVRIDGAQCRSASAIAELRNWLIVVGAIECLRDTWSGFCGCSSGTIAIQAAHFTALRDKLRGVMDLASLVTRADSRWKKLGREDPLWLTMEDLQRVTGEIEYVWAGREYQAVIKPLQDLERGLRRIVADPRAHDVAIMLLNAIEAHDSTSYSNAHNYLRNLETIAARVKRRADLEARLGAAAPELLSRIRGATERDELRVRFARLSEAWSWIQADSWLSRIVNESEKAALESEAEHCRKKIGKCVTELAAERAWSACFKAMTSEQRRHLVAWQQEIKKLGKGTGKHAARHRQQARHELEGARAAVPAWVMPVHRLADTLNVDSDRFDVVIIDEASQSGPNAIFLLEFAKQIIIVGDDKQIKPDVFVDQNVVEKLRKLHIPDVPSSSLIGSADTSLFEIGDLLYGGRVRLREHFRCMPEIIQFSNNLCYRSEPLIPLRQFGGSRLKPVVATRYIESGYQKGPSGRIVNPPEADAVVSFITEAIGDPKYAKKTLGVISLLGDDQARLIEQGLLKSIGPEEMQRHNIICGDAYAFQGDERDVIVLSMVSAPTEGSHIGVLSKQSDERRFNVAASRARDQMLLFHSVVLEDLSPKCLRYRLLEYCLNPQADPLEAAGFKLNDLRDLASSPVRRDRQRPPEPFDSWFEVDVCIRIMERGFRVVPQYEIAGYYVDLMVEGMRGRIAVECDGDEWHGPEQFDSDMFRQRELQRSGLPFFRPRGSEFYRGPAECLEPLWQMLDQDAASDAGRNTPAARAPRSTRLGDEARSAPDTNTTALRSGPTASRLVEDHPPIQEVVDLDLADGPAFEVDMRALDDATAGDQVSMRIVDANATSQHESGSAFYRVSGNGLGSSLSSFTAYREWAPRRMPDPRNCGLDEVMSGMEEIVRAEGPMICSRIYRLYARAAGIQRVVHQLRSIFNRAVAHAVRSGHLAQSEERGVGQMLRTVWLPNCPPVILRQRGSRTADEIPAGEIIAATEKVLADDPNLAGDDLVQRLSDEFGIGRLTSVTRALLVKALDHSGLRP